MEKLKFYDVKTKEKFETSDFVLEEKRTKNRLVYFAVAVSPSGTKAYRIISNAMYNSLKSKEEY